MRILIAPDSFKESLSAKEVALALKSGFENALPDADFDLMPIGDGGEGTLDALAENLNLEKKSIEILMPIQVMEVFFCQQWPDCRF